MNVKTENAPLFTWQEVEAVLYGCVTSSTGRDTFFLVLCACHCWTEEKHDKITVLSQVYTNEDICKNIVLFRSTLDMKRIS